HRLHRSRRAPSRSRIKRAPHAKALDHAGPDSARLGGGGISHHRRLDLAAQRRFPLRRSNAHAHPPALADRLRRRLRGRLRRLARGPAAAPAAADGLSVGAGHALVGKNHFAFTKTGISEGAVTSFIKWVYVRMNSRSCGRAANYQLLENL